MPEKKGAAVRRETFFEKLIRRILETVGGTVDRLFGRGRKMPDALPSTGDLSERLRRLIDGRAQLNQEGRKLAPHLIRLKYPWGQSSEEFLAALRKLQNELLVVAIDHVNDNRYTTLAPVKIQSKADVLTDGFTLAVGFDESDVQNSEQVEVPVEIYAKLLPPMPPKPKLTEVSLNFAAAFPNGAKRERAVRVRLDGKTNLTVGRVKESDVYLDDASVSKHHASLMMNHEGVLKVADIGSTNGTSLNGERIAYGKAYEITPESKIRFGDVAVEFAWEMPPPEPEPEIIEAEQQTAAGEPEYQSLSPVAGGGIKIGVASAKPKQEFSSDDTPPIYEGQIEDEPTTTVGKQIEDEPTTTVGKKIEEPETIAEDEDDPLKTHFGEDPFKTYTGGDDPFKTYTGETSVDENQMQATTQLPTDFTGSLEVPTTGKIESTAAPETVRDLSERIPKDIETTNLTLSEEQSLVGFESLLGASPENLKKRDAEKSESSEN